MRLLFVTQAVDTNDPVLGFVHGWLRELSQHFDEIVVVCLRAGERHLPVNVQVHSLGKERAPAGKPRYTMRFLRHIVRERGSYDVVFVHMNQEYILLAGLLWKVMGKRIYLWRNHYTGSFLTDLAAAFCTKVFCTSKFSYTAKYKKTVLMPVGIDTGLFKPVEGVVRKPRSVLFLGRIAPSKRPELLLEALGALYKRSVPYTATLCGPGEPAYVETLKRRAEELHITDALEFSDGIKNAEAPRLFNSHEVFVNLSPSGMLDKTIFEAAACGCTVLATSKDLSGSGTMHVVESATPEEVAAAIEKLLGLSGQEKEDLLHTQRQCVAKHSVEALAVRLTEHMQNL